VRRSEGQASVELVAFLPLVLLLALAIMSLLAAHAAGEEAGQAAEAGALALLQGRDPDAAAHAALPQHVSARVEVEGRRVHVSVRPHLPLPGLADLLTATATADAGPEAP
jgi:hypothetical protein